MPVLALIRVIFAKSLSCHCHGAGGAGARLPEREAYNKRQARPCDRIRDPFRLKNNMEVEAAMELQRHLDET